MGQYGDDRRGPAPLLYVTPVGSSSYFVVVEDRGLWGRPTGTTIGEKNKRSVAGVQQPAGLALKGMIERTARTNSAKTFFSSFFCIPPTISTTTGGEAIRSAGHTAAIGEIERSAAGFLAGQAR